MWLVIAVTVPLAQTSSYSVVPGDSLSLIAKAHDTSVAELMRLNGLSSSLIRAGQTLQVPQRGPRPRVGVVEHTVTAGETLRDLAARYGVSETSLQRSNGGLEGVIVDAALVTGQSILVPPGEGFVVSLGAGENLLSVALRYGLSVSELARLNNLRDASASVGMSLFIPEMHAAGPNPEAALSAVAKVETAQTSNLANPSPEQRSTPKRQHLEQQTGLFLGAAELLTRYKPVERALIWPLSGRLTSYYGRRNISVGGNTFHGGIDIGAAPGTPVVAAGGGVVTRSGWGGAYGYVVYVDHSDGRQTRYAHLSRLLVEVGQPVAQGDTLGLVGSSGASTGPHLHFELRFSGRSVDPLGYLPKGN